MISKLHKISLVFLTSFSAAYIALLPQFYLMYERGNRYTLGWSARGRASILIAIAILGSIYGLSYLIFRRAAVYIDLRQSRINYQRLVFNVAGWIGLALVCRSVMAIAFLTDQLSDTAMQGVNSLWTKGFCYVVVPGSLLVFYRQFFERATATLYRLLTIVFMLFLLQIFLWAPYADDSGNQSFPTTSASEAEPGSLYIFLFDEWSYEDSFGHPVFSLTNMPHLTELLGHSTLFHKAFSPAVCTGVSVPRFLYQTDARMRSFTFNDVMTRLAGNRFIPLKMKSIFDLSDRHFKFIAGTYLHYHSILGPKVDRIINFDNTGSRYSLMGRVRDFLLTQVDFLRHFGVTMPGQIRSPLSASGWYSSTRVLQSRIRPVLNDVLPKLPANTIAFFHMYLPHNPYLYYRDWTLRDSQDDSKFDLVTLYQENVYAIDPVIDDIVSRLKARGDYDSSMIVIMSDHAFKYRYGEGIEIWEKLDPGVQIPAKHIPLIIKYPGQLRGGDWYDPVLVMDLYPQFNDFLNTPDKMGQWVAQWNSGASSNPAYVAGQEDMSED